MLLGVLIGFVFAMMLSAIVYLLLDRRKPNSEQELTEEQERELEKHRKHIDGLMNYNPDIAIRRGGE